MVFKQKKIFLPTYAKTVWTWRAPQIKAKPFFCSFYLSRITFLGLSAHIWRPFLCCIFCFSFVFFFTVFFWNVVLQVCLWKFLAPTDSWWLHFILGFHLLQFVEVCGCLIVCVCVCVCVLVILSISVSSVWSLPLRWESEGKESQGKVSAGHREWEQIVWRTWQGSTAFSQSFPLDLSAVLDSFFLKSQISPWLFLSVY